jgi:hypothetical protein
MTIASESTIFFWYIYIFPLHIFISFKQNEIKGAEKVYASIDKPIYDSPADRLAGDIGDRLIEDIYNSTPEGLPEHNLRIVVGSIMLIIRNIDTDDDLANGTRVQIVKLGIKTITCRHITGYRAGDTFPLQTFRFTYGGTVDDYQIHGAVRWERIQFPLRPGMVMTINRSQGIFLYIIRILSFL